jgi:hypothetical protein
MPAFSHFFLKRLSARSKFSSSWIMTSDKFYFPPSWRLAAPACVQTAKASRDNGLGQANLGLDALARHLELTAFDIFAGASEGARSFGDNGRSGGAAKYAHSLRSFARLLGRSLKSPVAAPPPTPHRDLGALAPSTRAESAVGRVR